LHVKGFNVIVTYNEIEFLQCLDDCDVAWVVSHCNWRSAQVTEQSWSERLHKFHQEGKGLCLWGDNNPYFVHANAFLKHPDFGCLLEGCTPGQKTLAVGDDPNKPGIFGRHLLFSGIAKMYEGHTVCFPTWKNTVDRQKMVVCASSTDGNPVVLCIDHEPRGCLKGTVGRVVIDCAFTKLYLNWDTAGTARYVSNVSVWLLGLDTRVRLQQPLKGRVQNLGEAQETKEKEEKTG